MVAGFVHSQVLHALVELRVLHILMDGDLRLTEIAGRTGLDSDRARILCRAGVALGLLRQRRGGRVFGLGRQGAALLGVPGLEGMILHHGAFYRDMGDPASVLRGGDTELSSFWPYVFGAGAVTDPEVAARYSQLMADSQGLVAEETLSVISFKDTKHLADIGGGTGAFLSACLKATPGVLYDHSDETVAALLASVHAALPPGGRVVVSEPMTGGPRPSRAGDAYFAFYTMAMKTGRARAPEEIMRLLSAAGFAGTTHVRTSRPFVTSVITAFKADS